MPTFITVGVAGAVVLFIAALFVLVLGAFLLLAGRTAPPAADGGIPELEVSGAGFVGKVRGAVGLILIVVGLMVMLAVVIQYPKFLFGLLAVGAGAAGAEKKKQGRRKQKRRGGGRTRPGSRIA